MPACFAPLAGFPLRGWLLECSQAGGRSSGGFASLRSGGSAGFERVAMLNLLMKV
jgi:hypothetical protein